MPLSPVRSAWNDTISCFISAFIPSNVPSFTSIFILSCRIAVYEFIKVVSSHALPNARKCKQIADKNRSRLRKCMDVRVARDIEEDVEEGISCFMFWNRRVLAAIHVRQIMTRLG